MRRSLALLAVLAAGPVALADPPSRHRGEFLRMWDAILSGEPPVAGFGWFGPAEARYTWDRLAARDKNKDGRVTRSEFGGPAELFEALDRDGDGAITADDLDWSDDSRYARQMDMAERLLRRADDNGNKKVSRKEWAKLFDELAKNKKELEAEDLRRLLFPPSRGGPPPGMSGMPPKAVLLYGLLTGEIGSGAAGPKLDALAPDFTLKSPDGKTTITLSEFRGKKPVALIFGSFT
jgi:hypothetical protein